MLYIPDKRRCNGNRNDSKKYQLSVLLHKGELADKITTVTKQSDPKQRTSNTKKNKLAVGHGTYSGNEGSKSSDNRNKTGDDDGLASMFFKKTIGSDQMFRIKKRDF